MPGAVGGVRRNYSQSLPSGCFMLSLRKEPVHLNGHSGQEMYKGLSRSFDVLLPKVTTPTPPATSVSARVSFWRHFPRTPSHSGANTGPGLLTTSTTLLCLAPTTLWAPGAWRPGLSSWTLYPHSSTTEETLKHLLDGWRDLTFTGCFQD